MAESTTVTDKGLCSGKGIIPRQTSPGEWEFDECPGCKDCAPEYGCFLCLDEGDVLVECPESGCDQGRVTCPKCSGEGRLSVFEPPVGKDCLACRGHGVVKCGRCKGEGCVTEPCPEMCHRGNEKERDND